MPDDLVLIGGVAWETHAHRTPLLDIKPYVPAFDHFAVTRTGWYAGTSPVGVVADSRFERQSEESKTEAHGEKLASQPNS